MKKYKSFLIWQIWSFYAYAANAKLVVTFQNESALDSLVPEAPPFSFYDRHVSSQLILKNIVYYPSLTSSLSKATDRAIQTFLAAGHKFFEESYNFTLQSQSAFFDDALSVSKHYLQFAGRLCASYASKFTFHPQWKNWNSVVEMTRSRVTSEYLFTTESWLQITNGRAEKTAVVAALPKPERDRMERLREVYPRLATWDMFAMTPTAINMFQSLTGNVHFKWETSQTVGWKTVCDRRPPPDAKSIELVVKVQSPNPRQNHSAKQRALVRKSKTIVTPKIPSKRRKAYRPDFRHYIQHAWATAATYDSTYLILHCGRYERIGVRRRATQTLYLSGIIDTINTKNPSYRKLHIGLHIAILQDALNREKLTDPRPKKGRKRGPGHLDNDEKPSAKRPKYNPPSEVDIVLLSTEIAKRKLLLVNLDYGAFCSPAPSSFFRIGPSFFPGHAVPAVPPRKTRYDIHDCISVTLKEPLGHGAVGVVHPAIVELTLKSGKTLKHSMALKLAFTKEQRVKCENEFMKYSHLYGKDNVEGIVTVHGMFQDPESGAYGMLMDDAGQSLRRREIERGGDGRQVSTTVAEREAFTNALKSLHRAGVRHHDIRADNLLLNSQNKAFIIDLDQADHEVDEEKLDHELNCLTELLEGRYQDGSYYT